LRSLRASLYEPAAMGRVTPNRMGQGSSGNAKGNGG
jgi:hypothetical protein